MLKFRLRPMRLLQLRSKLNFKHKLKQRLKHNKKRHLNLRN
jgi:hypothetical protein